MEPEDPTQQTVNAAGADDPVFWVGIGASAGGLEALRNLVRNLPPVLSATYIVTQHMAPHHKSMLAEIIGRETDMPVLDVTDKLKPSANAIYITPPNSNIIVENGLLRLIDPSPAPAAPKPSADLFFTTLAEAKGDRAIGIVLSGTGSDGSDGVRAIRQNGGITISQDELTAKYASMPVSALETGCVDLVMSPEEIGAQFSKIVAVPRDLDKLRASPVNMDSVSELIQLLLDHSGVNFRHYKSATFQRRVERRMIAVSAGTLEEYVKVAKASTAEVDLLFRDLLISVTSFFRDTGEFEGIRSHIESIVESKRESHIRVWVAGTATGEEAYSLAMVFAEVLGGLQAYERTRIQIFATDIDDRAIEVARRGFYPETSLHEVPKHYIDEYFDEAPGGYTVKKSLREKVIFSVHNLAQDPPFLNLDMVSCRNLLIYFQPLLQAHVFARFHYSLLPHGLLFLGKSETVAAAESLFRMSGQFKHIFYQRPTADRGEIREKAFTPRSGASMASQTQAPGGGQAFPPPEARDLALATARFESLVSALGPDALLVSSELNILKAYGDVSRYIGVAAGPVDTTAASLLIEPFSQDVRVAVPSALRQGVTIQGLARQIPEKPSHRHRITVYPINEGIGDVGESTALVVFTEWEEDSIVVDQSGEEGENAAANSEAIQQLSRELAIAQTNLQHTVEELETSNEELQALNEELQSSNEELQSTNEELETSNEELQSTNEELSTVNEELQVNSQQLNSVNQSLQSILDNVAVPMLVVDRQLNITHSSSASQELFGVSPDLVLPHVTRCQLPPGYPELSSSITQAMELGRRVDIDIEQSEASAHMSVVPHFSASGEMVGAIVLITDNTAALRERNRQLSAAAHIAGLGHFALDLKSGRGSISDELYGIIGIDKPAIGEPTPSLTDFVHPENVDDLIVAGRELRDNGLPFEMQIRLLRGTGEEGMVKVVAMPGVDAEGAVIGIMGVVLDVTEQNAKEKQLVNTLAELSRSNEELNRFSYVCSHDMKEPVRMIEQLSAMLLDRDIIENEDERGEVINRITKNMGRLRQIIDSLLAYSRIDAKVEETVIDLRDVVEDIDETLSLAITEHNAEIVVGELPSVEGARVHFTQLFQNLIGNSLKFNDKEQPVVKVSAFGRGSDTILVVEDNGPGVPDEAKEKIFGLFDRLHRQDEIDGIGLGLSICQRIVSQYQGDIICIDSDLGGARFEITLPERR